MAAVMFHVLSCHILFKNSAFLWSHYKQKILTITLLGCALSHLSSSFLMTLKYAFKPFKGKYVYFFCFGNKWVFAVALESIGQFSLEIILQRNFYHMALIFYLRVHSFDVLFSNILLWFFLPRALHILHEVLNDRVNRNTCALFPPLLNFC